MVTTRVEGEARAKSGIRMRGPEQVSARIPPRRIGSKVSRLTNDEDGMIRDPISAMGANTAGEIGEGNVGPRFACSTN